MQAPNNEADGAAGVVDVELSPEGRAEQHDSGDIGDISSLMGFGAASGPGTQVEAVGLRRSMLECSLVVPFLTPVDASTACWFLDPVIGWQQQVFYGRLQVLGSDLLVALQCEDLYLLWVTLDILLDQLLVLQAMQSWRPVSG